MAIGWELVRVNPPRRRGERILLDPRKGEYVVGRSKRCDIQLISPTASREHADVRLLDDGSWQVVSRPGKQVLADGELIDGPCELCEGLNLEMGRDRLRCQKPGMNTSGCAEPVHQTASTNARPAVSRAVLRGLTISLGALALLLMVMILWRVTE